MKQVQCIKDDGYSYITLGKVYNVVEETEQHYKLKSDAGNVHLYLKRYFKEPVSTDSCRPIGYFVSAEQIDNVAKYARDKHGTTMFFIIEQVMRHLGFIVEAEKSVRITIER